MTDRFRKFLAKNCKNIIFLGFIIIVVSLPLMTDYILQGENVLSTLSRIELVKEGMLENFPVRIQPLSQTEYGSGAAFFQTDAFLLFPALLRKLGVGILPAYQLTMWLVNIAAAALAFVCFTKCFGRQDLGMIGSMLYTWCPYRINDLYINGDMGKSIAWCFLPLLLLGLYRLYTEREHIEKLWVMPTAALCLLGASSMTMFLAAVGMSVLWLAFMGKRILHKKMAAVILKTGAAVCLLNAWILIPQLYFMYKNLDMVGKHIPANIRAFGINPASYLFVFFQGGASADFWTNGMSGVQSLAPGFAVTLCVIFYLWCLFAGQYKEQNTGLPAKRILVLGLVFAWMGSSLFPWDIFQNKNLLFSFFLAWMHTPAVWGIMACLLFIFAAINTLGMVKQGKECYYKICLGITVGVSFLTTQFLIGNILLTRGVIRVDAAQDWGRLPMQIITETPMLWRASEAVSLAALVFLTGMSIVRRRKDVKKI